MLMASEIDYVPAPKAVRSEETGKTMFIRYKYSSEAVKVDTAERLNCCRGNSSEG